MTEKDAVDKLVRALRRRPGVVVFKHADSGTAGIPDVSFTRKGSTLWIEVKIFQNGGFQDRGLQHLTLKRLEAVGSAVYVLFDTSAVHVVSPARVKEEDIDVTASFMIKTIDGHDNLDQLALFLEAM